MVEHVVQKVATLNAVASLAINSVMDTFLQVLQNFQNHLQEHILSMSKLEHVLNTQSKSFLRYFAIQF